MFQRLWAAGRRWFLIGGICLGAAFPSAAFAAEHAFDARLSLTGSCKTSEVDLVPDPGPCPLESEGGPGIPGVDHPSQQFGSPRAIATDSVGDIYVADNGTGTPEGANGRIDIFNSEGGFITEIPDGKGPREVAVDSHGNLYVYDFQPVPGGKNVVLYEPTPPYNPGNEQIAYPSTPSKTVHEGEATIALDRENDHLFLHLGSRVVELKSAEENNEPVPGGEHIGEGILHEVNNGLTVDPAHDRIYASSREVAAGPYVILVFNLNAPHELLQTIKGSAIPPGSFKGQPALAVEEKTGDLFLYFGEGADAKIYQLHYLQVEGKTDENPAHAIEIAHSFKYPLDGKIAIDNSPASENEGYLYVPSQEANANNPSHVFAFGPFLVGGPEIEASSFAGVTETETELRATVNPNNAATSYRFEVTTEQRFEAEGFTGAQLVAQGQLPAVKSPFPVSGAASGLLPGTAYRFRVFVENSAGSDEAEGGFSTYPAAEPSLSCPNEALRAGLTALLPDCRAYELVSPPRTNARTPIALGHFVGMRFPSRQASPAGNAASFVIEGGTIPGYEATGSLAGDPYLSRRGPQGWITTTRGPNGAEASSPSPGSTSPDQGYSFFIAGGEGSAVVGGAETTYVRYPDGHAALIGRGSLASDPRAVGELISEGGGHIIFVSGSPGNPAIRLEKEAPQSGTRAIYDRTADEVTHVVSLLPGNKTPNAGQDARYVAASPDGRAVAFLIGGKLYLRFNDEETYEIGEGLTFAGLTEGGGRLFYMEGGNLKAFDVATKSTITLTTSGNVTPVNVSADGSTAYFLSPSALTSKANPRGQKAKAGQNNLYLSRQGQVSFIGLVTERDVKGEVAPGGVPIDGLGLWLTAVSNASVEENGRIGVEPSRTTPDGGIFLFESRASLAPPNSPYYDPEGHAEVYRYDSSAGSLTCLSCNPTGTAASGEASLQSAENGNLTPAPSSIFSSIENMRSDGRRAFFQSEEALVSGDTDGLQDVYEWEDQGVGSCARGGGCVYLISSGHSLPGRKDYLYGVSSSGDDVFFTTADLLVGSDQEETYSIYDARVGGGFAESPLAEPCEGEGCRPTLNSPPVLPPARTPPLGKGDNFTGCPKGKHKLKRHGKARCVKKKGHRKHRHHRKTGTGKKGGRK